MDSNGGTGLELTSKTKMWSARRAPNSTSSLTEEQKYELIAQVKSHECLWNRHNPLYSESNTKTDAWQSVEANMGILAGNAKSEWDSLRNTYNKTKSRLLKRFPDGHMTPEAEIAMVSWPFFRQMKFLDTCSTTNYRWQGQGLGRPSSSSNYSQIGIDVESEPSTSPIDDDNAEQFIHALFPPQHCSGAIAVSRSAGPAAHGHNPRDEISEVQRSIKMESANDIPAKDSASGDPDPLAHAHIISPILSNSHKNSDIPNLDLSAEIGLQRPRPSSIGQMGSEQQSFSRKRKIESYDSNRDRLQEPVTFLSPSPRQNTNSQSQDLVGTFCGYLESSLRELSAKNQKIAINDLQNVLFQIQMKEFV